MRAAIHMWAVFMPLGVVWIDAQRAVVDTTVARPWRVYLPRAAARYVLESSPQIVERFHIGDRVSWDEPR